MLLLTKKRTLVFIALLLVIGRTSQAFTLHECIGKALENHPSIRSGREGLNAGSSRVTQATSPYYPQVQASTGYAENHALGGALGDTVTKQYTTTLSVNQLLYDFGKTGNARDAAKFGERAAERDLNRVVQEVVLNVKQAYYALLQAKKLVNVSQQTLAQTEGHLKQADAFFRAGSKPRFDVTRAIVDVNNAKLGVINAQNAVRLKTIALYNTMGMDPQRDIEIEDASLQPAVLMTLEQAQQHALLSRPETQKAESDIRSAQARVESEEANFLPTLSAAGAYNWAQGTSAMGPFRGDVQNSWNAGITLSLPLFEGGLTKGKVGEARANQRALEAQRDALRQSILLDVNQAYADIESAQARIQVMDSSLKSARESLSLAEGRYSAGVGPSLEVTDAQVAAAKAETDYVQALYDYQLAVARLDKAMGRGLE
jgi:outer membrane protein